MGRHGSSARAPKARPACHLTRLLLSDGLAGILACRRQTEQPGGLYGIGLRVEAHPPHKVLKVAQMLTGEKQPISTVMVGDSLVKVDGVTLDNRTYESVESLIIKEQGTIVRLLFRSANSGCEYAVQALRHVPICTWTSKQLWCELRPEMVGQQHLMADVSIVNALEAARRACLDEFGCVADLLQDRKGRAEGSALGLEVASEKMSSSPGLHPCEITSISTWGPAKEAGNVKVGDIIVAIDGTPVSASNVLSLIKSDGHIASMSQVKTLKGPFTKHSQNIERHTHKTSKGPHTKTWEIPSALRGTKQLTPNTKSSNSIDQTHHPKHQAPIPKHPTPCPKHPAPSTKHQTPDTKRFTLETNLCQPS